MGRFEMVGKVQFERTYERTSHERTSLEHERERRTKSTSRGSRDRPTDITLKIPIDDAQLLQEHARNWHDRQERIVAARIQVYKKALGLDRERDRKSKTRNRVTEKITERILTDQKASEKAERDERQLDCWRAARDTLAELDPPSSLCDALEMLYLGPLINTMQHLDGINETQTQLAELRAKYENKRRALRRVEYEIEEIQKGLEEKDGWIRRRMWKAFRYNRSFLEKFSCERDRYKNR